MSEINVVPYIDVMLVLLIIFMVTAPLMNLGVEVNLPDAAAEPMSDDSGDPLTVTVTAGGELYLDTGDAPELVNKKPLMKPLAPLFPAIQKSQGWSTAGGTLPVRKIKRPRTFFQAAAFP